MFGYKHGYNADRGWIVSSSALKINGIEFARLGTATDGCNQIIGEDTPRFCQGNNKYGLFVDKARSGVGYEICTIPSNLYSLDKGMFEIQVNVNDKLQDSNDEHDEHYLFVVGDRLYRNVFAFLYRADSNRWIFETSDETPDLYAVSKWNDFESGLHSFCCEYERTEGTIGTIALTIDGDTENKVVKTDAYIPQVRPDTFLVGSWYDCWRDDQVADQYNMRTWINNFVITYDKRRSNSEISNRAQNGFVIDSYVSLAADFKENLDALSSKREIASNIPSSIDIVNVPQQNHLVAYFDMQNKGDTLTDYSVTGNDLINSGTKRSKAPRGFCRFFDGVSNKLSNNHVSAYDITSDLSVDVWAAHMGGTANYSRPILTKSYDFRLNFNNSGGLKAEAYIGTGAGGFDSILSKDVVSPGTFHHIMMTYKGSTKELNIYVDEQTPPEPFITNSGSVRAEESGFVFGKNDYYYNFVCGRSRLWNTTLTYNEFLELHKTEKRIYGIYD